MKPNQNNISWFILIFHLQIHFTQSIFVHFTIKQLFYIILYQLKYQNINIIIKIAYLTVKYQFTPTTVGHDIQVQCETSYDVIRGNQFE
jgi:hypothetical protein